MSIPFYPYKLFFLYIEPIAAIGGACYAGLLPGTYLSDLIPHSTRQDRLPTSVLMALYQLSNLYLLFALNEHIVLSSTDNIKTWKRLLVGLLVADFGHLVSVYPLGIDAYWKFWTWNLMMWGSVGFVYVGASMRMAFLYGKGLSQSASLERVKET